MRGLGPQWSREHERARDEEAGDQDPELEGSACTPDPRPGAPGEEHGSDQQIGRRVAQPPGPPQRAVIGPRLNVAQTEGGHTDGGAHRRADHGAEQHDPNRVLQPFDGIIEADEPAVQRRSDDRLECVAGGDGRRDGKWLMRRGVRDEGSEKDGGPHLGAVEQERCEREAGGRPHQRHLFGGERHREAELRRRDVDHGDHDERRPY